MSFGVFVNFTTFNQVFSHFFKLWTQSQTIHFPSDLKKLIFKYVKRFFKSNILSLENEEILLSRILQLKPFVNSKNISFNLLFSQINDCNDNNSNIQSIFHAKCDNKGPTITIILSEENHIFGGFTR